MNKVFLNKIETYDIEKLKENEKKAYKAAKEEFVRIISPRK